MPPRLFFLVFLLFLLFLLFLMLLFLKLSYQQHVRQATKSKSRTLTVHNDVKHARRALTLALLLLRLRLPLLRLCHWEETNALHGI